jgi:hypothetical protein
MRDYRAGRRRRVGAGKTAAGQHAHPSARPGARWKWLIEDGTYRSAAEIAEAEGVTRSFVNRVLRLTLLAPDIQEAILDGRQPKGMTLEELIRTMPSGWEEQREIINSIQPKTSAEFASRSHQKSIANA